MMEEDGFEVASRRLCPDGSCTGLIGADERCSECGRLAADASASNVSSSADRPHGDDVLSAADERSASSALDDGDAAFDANRPLCPDGSCVGVLGPDGRCSVCGKVVSTGEGR